jgi:hypothetical protein
MRDDANMRTTLEIDDDVLQAAKELALARGTTAGRVLSDLARKGLTESRRASFRNGVPLLPARRRATTKPTMKMVNELRDDT